MAGRFIKNVRLEDAMVLKSVIRFFRVSINRVNEYKFTLNISPVFVLMKKYFYPAHNPSPIPLHRIDYYYYFRRIYYSHKYGFFFFFFAYYNTRKYAFESLQVC